MATALYTQSGGGCQTPAAANRGGVLSFRRKEAEALNTRENTLRGDALSIWRAGVEAVDPYRLVRAHLEKSPLPRVGGRLLVAGAGKGAGPMAAAVEEALGERVAEGVVVVPDGHRVPLRRVRLREAAHPVPDRRGAAAAREVMALAEEAGEDDLLLCLLSGGGSALLPAPAPPVTLDDLRAVTSLLLASGASIGEVNTVRKHLSLLSGGGLARLAHPARVVTLALSDVVGNLPEVIASGPTVADPTTFARAQRVLASRGLMQKVPPSVRRRLQEGRDGFASETPKPDSPLFAGHAFHIVGDNGMALEAAAARAQALGYSPLVLSTALTGEAREEGAGLAAVARGVAERGLPVAPPACLLCGGETTVTLRGAGKGKGEGAGKGGRNQELALGLARSLAGLPGVAALAAGTDGTDGPTGAAGALVDGQTIERAAAAGLDPERALAENDSYPFFLALGDLLVTGPTRTNVMDLTVILVGKRSAGGG